MYLGNLIDHLVKDGYRLWGYPHRRSNGSVYQCYRKGNGYVWVGKWYIEVSASAFAFPYREAQMTWKDVVRYIQTGEVKDAEVDT